MLTTALAALRRVLGIEPADQRVLTWAGVANFCLNAGELLAWTVLLGRYLSELGPSWMPVMYIATNLCSAALFVAIARFGEAGAARTGVRIWALAAAACFVVVGLRPDRDGAAWVFVSFLIAWGYEIVFEPEFWGWAGRTLPLRVLRRVSPGVGACGLAGRLVGSVLATDPLGMGSISGLVLVAAGLTLAALPALAAAERAAAGHEDCRPGTSAVPDPEAGPEEEGPDLAEAGRVVLASPLLRRVLVGSLLMGFAMGSVDYPLSALARQAYPDAGALAAFFGQLCLAIYLLAVLLQVLGTGALLRRLPLSVAYGALPAFALVGGGLAACFPVLPAAAAITLGLFVLVRAFHTPVTLVLLGPVPPRLAGAARALSYGLGSALGFLGSGLGLELLGGGEPRLVNVYLALALGGALVLLLAAGTDRAYLEGLRDLIHTPEEARDALGTALEGAGETAAALLESGQPELLAALRTALAAGSGSFEVGLAEELRALSPPVALLALRALADRGVRGPLTAELLARLVADPSPEVGWAAAEAGVRLGDPEAAAALGRLVQGAGPATTRLRAAGVLLWCGAGAALAVAVSSLRGGLGDPEPATRAVAVRALSLRPSARLRKELVAALADPSPVVVRAAGRGLMRTRDPASVAELEAARARAEDPEVAEELDRASRHLRDGTLATVLHLLGSLDARERSGLAETFAGLRGGPELALLGPALTLEPAPLRRAAVLALQGAATGGWLEAMGQLLAGEAPPASPVPLAMGLRDLGLTPDSPVGRLLVEVPGEGWRAPLLQVAREALEALPPAPSRGELARGAFLLGYALGMADAFEGAVATLTGADPRRASAAEELLETGGAPEDLRGLLVGAANRIRQAPPPGDP